MRIMSLNEMLTELRYEARLSGDVSHGSHLTDRYVSLLRRTQEEIYDTYDWPMLNVTSSVAFLVGQRYSAYPANMDLTGVSKLEVKMDGDEGWAELTYGIEAEQLNQHDSDADERHERVLRWNHYLAPGAEVVNTNMFELWPLPTTGGMLRFSGKRKLNPLTDVNTDHSTLDGMAIVLHAAGEILAGQKAEDAQLKIQKAQARIMGQRQAQSKPDNRPLSMYPTAGPSRHPSLNFKK